MAGSLVVLHEKDSGSEKTKNITTNVGVQSIVDKEDKETAQLVYRASAQRSITQSLVEDCERFDSIISTYTYVANSLYDLIQQVALENEKIDKMYDIESEAIKLI